MICKKCLKELTTDNIYSSDPRYCITCGTEHATYLSERRQILVSLCEMSLQAKIIQTKYLIKCAVTEFGLNKVYVSYSGGKDSTVLSHIAKSMYPKGTMSRYQNCMKWVIQETAACIVVLGFILN